MSEDPLTIQWVCLLFVTVSQPPGGLHSFPEHPALGAFQRTPPSSPPSVGVASYRQVLAIKVQPEVCQPPPASHTGSLRWERRHNSPVRRINTNYPLCTQMARRVLTQRQRHCSPAPVTRGGQVGTGGSRDQSRCVPPVARVLFQIMFCS